MFVVFEGIDGSGKTTISNRVAQALRERGLRVEHLREGGSFASGVTQRIRDFCRDARNLALTPRAEFLLYVAREVQLGDEVLAPALAHADVIIADRYLYTAEVLASVGRALPVRELRPVLEVAAGGIWPDLAILIDVDPSVARGRRKVSKILTPDPRPSSRKGLTGSGLQQRLREGYRAIAAREPERWLVVDNADADLESVTAGLIELIQKARECGVAAALAAAKTPDRAGPPVPRPVRPMDSPRAALEEFLDWVDERCAREPPLAAYVLAGLGGPEIDERRMALSRSAPRVIARGLRGLADGTSWQLRRLLLEVAPDEIALGLVDLAAPALEAWRLRELLAAVVPAEVAQSLQGLDDETAWALRAELYALVPDAVVGSLALLGSPRAWEIRDRWLAERGGLMAAVDRYEVARVAARSVTGLDDERAWEIRKAAREAAPAAALLSLKGTTSEHAWHWRERALERAPKPVLATIDLIDDPRAWSMRAAMAERCREALDSMIGVDHPVGWEIREACLDLWPAQVVKSLGVLVSGARGYEMLMRELSAYPDNISLLKQGAAIASGGHLTPRVLAA
jgi:dTMP kinase